MKKTALYLLTSSFIAAAGAQEGSVETRFGEQGVVLVGNAASQERFSAVVASGDGGVFVAGSLHEPGFTSRYDMTVVKLAADGRIDTDWGDAGALVVGPGGDSDSANALLSVPLAAGGQGLLVAGYIEPGNASNTDFTVARVTSAGNLDPSFGDPAPTGGRKGFATFNMGPTTTTSDDARAVAMQSNGDIFVAGTGDGADFVESFAIARLTPEGVLDPSFVNGGKLIVPRTGPNAEYLTQIARPAQGLLDPARGLVVAGYIFGPRGGLLRRFHSDGTYDLDFGNGGTLVIQDVSVGGVKVGLSKINAAALQADGKIVVAGTSSDRDFVVMRFFPDGTRDPAFGANGRVAVKIGLDGDTDEPLSILLQDDGKLLVAGYSTVRRGASGTPELDFTVVRLRPDGRLDLSWGDAGRVVYPVVSPDFDRVFATAITVDGGVVLAGEADVMQDIGGNFDGAVMKLAGPSRVFADGFEAFGSAR